jgi:hypothetical protein
VFLVGRQRQRHGPQHGIPFDVAVSVVDAFELVEIEHRHGVKAARPHLGEAALQSAAVQQPGKVVSLRPVDHQTRFGQGDISLLADRHHPVHRAQGGDDHLQA